MKTAVKAYAKINLFLDITGRLPDGYHLLNTVMRRVELYDTVEVEALTGRTGISVTCDDPSVPTDERNTAYRAVKAFFGNEAAPYVSVNIEKRIPSGAGLGGGSADAAAVLSALNVLFGERYSESELITLGASVGADVPFCVFGRTAICKGIGERIIPIDCPNDHFVAIAKPSVSCDTAAAYRAYDSSPVPEKEGFDEFAALLPLGAKRWCGGVYNVFERLYADKTISAIKGKMLESGALAASLTGSGSAVFGIFADEESAKRALSRIDAPFGAAVRPI